MQDNNISREELLKKVNELDAALAEKKQERSKPNRTKSLMHSLLIYLLVIGIVLVPVTLSRYVSIGSGGAAGAIADIKYTVGATPYSYGNLTIGEDDNGAHNKVYAIVCDVSISNEGTGVSYTYTLNLRASFAMDDDDGKHAAYDNVLNTYKYSSTANTYTQLAYPNESGATFLTITNKDGTTSGEAITSAFNIATITSNAITSATAGKIYYACDKGDGNGYVWQETTSSDASVETLTVTGEFPVYTEGSATTHNYKIIQFIDLTDITISSIYPIVDTAIFYEVTCEQKD